MSKYLLYLTALILIFVPLYPKFPLFGVADTFVAIRLEDILIAAVLAVYGVTALKSYFSDNKNPVSRAVIVYLVIGFVASFSGIFLTKTAAPGLGILHALRRVEYMGLFFVGMSFLKNLKGLNFITRIIILTGLLVAVYGIGQQFLNFPVISTTNSEFSKGLALTLGPGARINSTFAGHYDLAAYSVFPLLLIIALLPQSKTKWPLIIIGGLLYWTLLLSASRITFASLVLCAGLMVIVIRKFKWLPVVVTLAILGVLVSPQLRGRYLEIITNHLHAGLITVVTAQTPSKDVNSTPDALMPTSEPEDRSLNIRLNAEWPNALRAFIKNPVLGTGFSSVGLAVDNDFLRSLAETGLLGLAAFLLVFIRFFKTSRSYLLHFKPDPKSAFIAAVSLSVFSLLINSIFIDVFEASKIAIFAWTTIGIAESAKTL